MGRAPHRRDESVEFDLTSARRAAGGVCARERPRTPLAFAPRVATARSDRFGARAYLPPLRRDRGPVPEIPRRLFVQVPFSGEKSLQAMHVSAIGPAPEVAGEVARVAVAGRHPRLLIDEPRVRVRVRKGGRCRAAARAIGDLMMTETRRGVTRKFVCSKSIAEPVGGDGSRQKGARFRCNNRKPLVTLAAARTSVCRRGAGIASRWR